MLFLPALAYAGRPLGIGARDVIKVIGAQFSAALATAGVGFGLRVSMLSDVPAIERIAILVVVYLAMYLIVVVGLFRVTVPVEVCRSLVREMLPRGLKARARMRLPEARE
jgi:PST family polysaccharide transporter